MENYYSLHTRGRNLFPSYPSEFLENYYRVGIKTSSFDTYICIPPGIRHGDEVLRNYFDNTHSPLLEFFTKKWIDKAAADLETWIKYPTAYSSMELSFALPVRYSHFRRHESKSFGYKYWLSFNGEDGDTTSLKQGTRQVALVIASNQVRSLKNTMPYHALFGGATGLPWRRKFQGDPRQDFGMKKIGCHEYLVWRKPGARTKEHNKNSGPTIAVTQLDLPPEILYLILSNLIGVKTDMIPTMLCCRLVNHTWYQVASDIAFSNITASYGKCRFFLNSPKKTILPYLRKIQLHFFYVTNVEKFLVVDLETAPNETDIVDIVRHSPQLELFVIKGKHSTFYSTSIWTLHVIGRPSSKPNSTTQSSSSTLLPPSDLLERATIKDLETCTKLFKTEAQSTKKTRLYFFCLASPSNTFLAALTHILNTLVKRASGAEVGVRFEGLHQWPFSEAMDWLERKHEWIIEHWPKQVFIIVAGKDRTSTPKFVKWRLGRPFPGGNIKDRNVNKDLTRIRGRY